jgi:hypothetical protein
LLDAPRQVTSEFHLLQAQRLLEFDAGRELDTVLVYAALELRAAIERTLFELLYLVRELEISDEVIAKARSMDGLQALLREADSTYRKTMEFTRLVAQVTPGIPAVNLIDTGYLRRKWQELSEYCHLQFRPDRSFESPNREFQRRGFRLLHEVLERFIGWYKTGSMGLIKRSTMPEETRAIYDKFVAGDIDADQARRILVLAEPVLRQRRDAIR